jgi:pimeloyl-ACP methyl ester carboxylesterase
MHVLADRVGAHFTVVSGGSHLVVLENPARVAELVRAHLVRAGTSIA